MRQKMITLDPTTWEFASRMTNFSGWVRKQIAGEMAKAAKPKEWKFESHCSDCKMWFKHPTEYAAKYHFCPKCDRACDYMSTEVTE
jgi:hypothetical protein